MGQCDSSSHLCRRLVCNRFGAGGISSAGMKGVPIQPDFNDWRTHARALLQQGYTPEDLDL